jgi:hypothetical protein
VNRADLTKKISAIGKCPVKFPDVLDQLPNERTVRRVNAEPYVTPDGVTVIPVARIKEGRRKRRSGDAEDDHDETADQGYGFAGVPIGVFVVRRG